MNPDSNHFTRELNGAVLVLSRKSPATWLQLQESDSVKLGSTLGQKLATRNQRSQVEDQTSPSKNASP